MMKRIIDTVILASVILLLPIIVIAQKPMTGNTSTNADTAVGGKTDSLKQLGLLRDRKALLEKQLSTLSPVSAEYALTLDWIRELAESIEYSQQIASDNPNDSLSTRPNLMPVSDTSPTRAQAFTEPAFKLSRPTGGATNEIAEVTLAWTEDHPCPTVRCAPVAKSYAITKFLIEIATDDLRFSNNRLAKPVFTKEVSSDGSSAQAIKVPKETLKSGQKYYWQVLAEYAPQGGATSLQKIADNAREAPQSFKTAAQTFDAFERRGLTLQRAVSGDDATEGAQFGFLKTFNQKTVYTADFALIYNRRLSSTQRTNIAFQASVQGSLTSDDSQSENALQFRAGAIVDRNLKRNTINHLYTSLGVKYEADQKFNVGKLISENMLTPTFPALGIGIPFGRPSDAVQFRWRPYFYFDIGRSFKSGDSAEVKNTVLRLTPRVRTILTLNFLRRALNLNDSFLFADDFFYFLPLEKTKNRRNMFTSGFVLQVSKDFGFGLTYKSGEAAPKFKHIHTFGGVLTIRFGKE
jgi:hypothetical protein